MINGYWLEDNPQKKLNRVGMRIVFMGTPDFAVPSLDILVRNGYNIVGVITATDKMGGRGGKQLLQSAVKKYAVEHNLKVLQPKNLKDQEFISELKALKADLQIVVAFRMLPEVVWKMPKLGTYNLHGSLLPKYRGAAPIHWAVINGEKETGVTSFKLKHEIDTGDIAFQEKLPINENETTGDIHDKMMYLGAEVILKTVQAIENNSITFSPQNPSEVSKAPKIWHDTCEIDFTKSTSEVHNFIRGLSPFPGAYMELLGKKVKILKSTRSMDVISDSTPGSFLSDNKSYLKLKCSDGYIDVLTIKMEGKRQMDIQTFLNGYDIVKEMEN